MAVQQDDYSPPAELPRYLTRFTGREHELAELLALIDRADIRMLTLVGPGGVGKTRLMVEAMSRAIRAGDSQLIFLDGASLEHPEDVLPALAVRIGLEQADPRVIGELLSEAMAGQSILAVLDNMEHLVDASLELGALVHACPGLRLFLTSRTPMRLSHERLFVLEPLPTVVGANEEWSPAADLLLDRAELAGAHISRVEPPRVTIEAICAQLDGLPLAIELAAPRLRLMSPDALLALLTRRLVLMSDGPVDGSSRHNTLQAAIAWSYALLGEDDQRLMRWLGVFPESFSLETASQLWYPEFTEARRESLALDRLSELFDQGLLQLADDEFVGQARFRMLVSIRDFAHQQLVETGELLAAQARLAEVVEQLVMKLESDLTGPRQAEAMNLLAVESSTIRLVFDWSMSQGDIGSGLRLVAGLWRYWANRGLLQDGRTVIDRVLTDAPVAATQLWGSALRGAAVIAELQNDWGAARVWGERAISVWETLEDSAALARSWVDLGNVSSSTGDLDRARDAYGRAIEFALVCGDQRMATVARCSMGTVALRQGLAAEAADEYETALPLMRRLQDQWLLAMTLANYAIALCRVGRQERAIACLNECLAIRSELGDASGRAMALLSLEEAMGEAELGGERAREALEIAQRLNAPDLIGPASVNLGVRALRSGDKRRAGECLADALRAFQMAESPIFASETIELIAELAERSDPALAARLMGGAAAAREARAVTWDGQHATRGKALDRRLEGALGSDRTTSYRNAGAAADFDELAIEALLLAQHHAQGQTQGSSVNTLVTALSEREQMVLRLIVDGKSDREIGEELYISPKTANRHVMSILAKLDCRNRTAATARALQLGIV